MDTKSNTWCNPSTSIRFCQSVFQLFRLYRINRIECCKKWRLGKSRQTNASTLFAALTGLEKESHFLLSQKERQFPEPVMLGVRRKYYESKIFFIFWLTRDCLVDGFRRFSVSVAKWHRKYQHSSSVIGQLVYVLDRVSFYRI